MPYCPVSKHGFTFVGFLLILSLVSYKFSSYLTFFFLCLSILSTYFFRDPKKSVPSHDGLVLSPADGVVSSIEVVDSPLGDGSRPTRVSVFLNIFNIHVNRSPVTGVVKSVKRRPGKFLSALSHNSITQNEMVRTVFQSHHGNHTVVTEQLAGLVARRAYCDLNPGDVVKLGSRMGIIKFGSRVNIFLPPGVKPLVVQGQKVSGGETVVAYLDPKLSESNNNFQYEVL